MLNKLRLRRFCCCCSLQTGAYVIAALGWVGNLTYGLSYQKGGSGETVVISFMSLCMLGVSASLVYGVYTSNRYYTIPWLGVKFVECCFLTIVTLICFFALFVEEDVTDPFILFAIFGLITGGFWYFFLCVWSLYMDMGEAVNTLIPAPGALPMPESYPQTTVQVPFEQVPIEALQMQQYPIQGYVMQQVPMQGMPMQQVPFQGVPMQQLPMQEIPKQAISLQQMPPQQIVHQGMGNLTLQKNAAEDLTNPHWL